MRVVLIGFMGSGKSTVGALLAERLGLAFFDLDAELLQGTEAASVSEIFTERGEDAFRALELETARRFVAERDAVLASGGGSITRESTASALRTPDTVFVYLHVPFEVAQERVGSGTDRPLFKDPAKARELFETRTALYERHADLTIDGVGEPGRVATRVALGLQHLRP